MTTKIFYILNKRICFPLSCVVAQHTEMLITVTMADEANVVFHLDVPDSLVVADFKAMCERQIFADCLAEKGLTIPIPPAAEMVLIADIHFLHGCLFDGREGRSVSVKFIWQME